jgi:hypothetical protein
MLAGLQRGVEQEIFPLWSLIVRGMPGGCKIPGILSFCTGIRVAGEIPALEGGIFIWRVLVEGRPGALHRDSGVHGDVGCRRRLIAVRQEGSALAYRLRLREDRSILFAVKQIFYILEQFWIGLTEDLELLHEIIGEHEVALSYRITESHEKDPGPGRAGFVRVVTR